MSVKRKLFLSMAAGIIGMGLLFVFLTQTVVWGILRETLQVDRDEQIAALTEQFTANYISNGGSWEGIASVQAPGADYVLMTPSGEELASYGDRDHEFIRRLGIRRPVTVNEETIAVLFYIDDEVAGRAIARLGISSSVTFLLLVGALMLTVVALLGAHWLSKRLTAPLHSILPAINRLGQGEYGVQVPVVSKDEYGTVAEAFNAMSEQMKRTEEARRNLTADVAHELRTPLTIIRGKLDYIQQSGKTIEPENLLPLQDELIRLTKLVDDLQQLSLAEAKRLPLERKNTSILPLLERVIDRLAPDAEAKHIQMSLNCDIDPPKVDIDPHRMAQVFLNLVGNAIRYTPEGGSVTIRVAAASAALQVSVSDTGPGIAPEHIPALFDRFYRTDEARSRHSGGMGLGLAIAKQLVLNHNGTIEAVSTLGQGTTFTVRLPIN